MKLARPRRRPRRVQPDIARARILDAAIAEFAAHGYPGASTNAIAEAAGVAKGLVFHHFGTKADLYVAIVDQVGERVVDSYLNAPDPWPTELFDRLHAFSLHKVRMFQRDPQSYRVLAMLADAPAELRERLFATAARVRATVWPILLRGVDASRLRPPLTLEEALETIVVLGEGLERQIVARISVLPDRGASQMEQIVDDVWKHYERLRDGLYGDQRRMPRRNS
jgi:TetR/AcrR family transcriptional regulator